MRTAVIVVLAILAVAHGLNDGDFLNDFASPGMVPVYVLPAGGQIKDQLAAVDNVLKQEPDSARAAPASTADPDFNDIFAIDAGADPLADEVLKVESDADKISTSTIAAASAVGQPTADEIAAKKQQADSVSNELALLKQLISHGEEIMNAMPAKKARMQELEQQLGLSNGALGKAQAVKQLAEQQQLAKEVDAKIAELTSKIEELNATKQKLADSIAHLQQIAAASDAEAAALLSTNSFSSPSFLQASSGNVAANIRQAELSGY